MKNKVSLSILVFFLFSGEIFSQVANYSFSETTGSYQAINANVALMSTSGTIGTSSTNQLTAALPFSFCLGGTTFAAGSTFSMYHDGWAAFGNPAVTTTTITQPLTNFNNCLSVFGTDLRTTGTSSYGARVIGTAPFRVLVMQWGQIYFGNSGGTSGTSNNYWRRVTVPNVNGATAGDDTPGNNDRLHFQIRLYESSGVIEFLYCITDAPNTVPGNRHGGITSNIQVGLRGASASDFNVRTKTSTTTPWNSSTSAGTALPSGTSNTMTFNNQRAVAANRPSSVTPASPGSTTTTAGPGTATIFRWTPVGSPSDPPATHSGCYNPLPVELSHFLVEPKEEINLVQWSTLSELNSDYFNIERSLNGGDWQIVGRVQSAGNSAQKLDYFFEDTDFDAAINYYRLVQVDFDGTTNVFEMTYADNRITKPDLVRVYNLFGQEVGEGTKGFVIELYSDGSSKKYFRE